MHSRSSLASRCALIVMLGATLTLSAHATYAQSQPRQDGPSRAEVIDAIDQLKADPNLSQERKTRVLRWVKGDEKPKERSGLARWIIDFFNWLGQLSRALVWVVGGLLAVALVALVIRMFKHADLSGRLKPDLLPTHVRDLDIRPESLPDDIGGAAFELWERGERRAALALLYRGVLSRLVHVHRIPIRDSTTEGDTLTLARHLPSDRKDYVTQLVRTWQRATYGGHEPQTQDVYDLCRGFAAALASNDGTESERT